MHISEGILRPEILIAGAVISAPFVLYALKKLKNEEIPLVAVFSALFFLVSFIHVPIGPSSVHLVMGGIMGAVLGPRAYLAIFIGLLLQGLLFGYGGLGTLGVNSFNIAAPALIGGWLFALHAQNIYIQKIQYFSIGFLPIFLSASLLSLTLALNGEAFWSAAKIALIANTPLMFLEGFITLFALLFLQKVYPKIFRSMK